MDTGTLALITVTSAAIQYILKALYLIILQEKNVQPATQYKPHNIKNISNHLPYVFVSPTILCLLLFMAPKLQDYAPILCVKL